MDTTNLVPRTHRVFLYSIAGVILALLVIPILLVVPMSFSGSSVLQFPPRNFSLRWYEAYFGSEEWMQATYVSFVVALLTAVISTPLGTLAAWGVRLSSGRAASAFWAVLMTPMIVPGILVAVGVFFLFARIGLTNSMPGLVAAHVMHALPYVFITVSSGLKNFDLQHERVARCLGAHRAAAFAIVVLPQIQFHVVSAAFLAFMSSLDEVVIASFLTGGDMATLPKRMFAELRSSIDPTIAAVSSMLIVISIGVFTAGEILKKKGSH